MRKRSCDKAGRNLCLRDASRKHQDQMATRLLVFYDRACPLCAAEMDTLNTISKPHMSEYPYGEQGIAQRHRKIEGGR